MRKSNNNIGNKKNTDEVEIDSSSVKYVFSMKGFCAGGGFRTVKITNQFHFIGWQGGIDNFFIDCTLWAFTFPWLHSWQPWLHQ